MAKLLENFLNRYFKLIIPWLPIFFLIKYLITYLEIVLRLKINMENPVQLFDITFSNHDYLTRLQNQVYGEWTETFEWDPNFF